MQGHLRETEPVAVVEEVEEVEDSAAFDKWQADPIQWNIGDYFEDDQGRRGWIKSLDSQLAVCIIYGGDRPSVENLGLSSLVEKIT
jgi:hypothetical protein